MEAKMTYKLATVAVLATALAVAPVTPAHAAGWHHHGGGWGGHGRGFGLFDGLVVAGAAVTGAAVALATAPFQIVGDAVAPPPVYAAPPAYGYAPAYYPQQRVVYAYPQPQAVYAYPQQPYPVQYAYPQQ